MGISFVIDEKIEDIKKSMTILKQNTILLHTKIQNYKLQPCSYVIQSISARKYLSVKGVMKNKFSNCDVHSQLNT